jgi:pyruvate, water dikinase
MKSIRWFEELGMRDVPSVGGKNASLGEMFSHLKNEGIIVPEGFATTAESYFEFLETNHLKERIKELLNKLGKEPLAEIGKEIRALFLHADFSENFKTSLESAYLQLGKRYKTKNVDVAVRSSATAEDLPDASFAGQQETFLNVRGIEPLLDACRKCYASLFTDRAISYREAKGFDHLQIALSIGVQKMIRSDKAAAGVMFTLDTETGFRELIVINASWGLGENVVQGTVTPDEYRIFKPLFTLIEKTLGDKEKKMVYTKTGIKNIPTSKKERERFALNEEEIIQLAKWGVAIEQHYKQPMDIEWAKDGKSGKLFIVQARPETVQSHKDTQAIKTYQLTGKGKKLVEGLAIGEAIVAGKAQAITDIKKISAFIPGSILVTRMTSPDWVPIMKQAKGIITDHGGRTSHAAIVSRELGLPAIVGTHRATELLKNNEDITLSCAEGEKGAVYQGILSFEEKVTDLGELPEIKTELMLNISSPAEAMRWWHLPCRGIGLARMEFIINNTIKIHPMALVHLDRVTDKKEKKQIENLTKHYPDKSDYFVQNLSQGIALIAASRYPDPVIVRLSDFKTNEYANLIGGKNFEPKEENPMLGFRGASRYYNDKYKEGFALECRSIKRVREEMGLTNVIIMVPFCRTVQEGKKVLDVLAENGLKRGEKELKIYVMCEIPSNIILAEEFAKIFDGFSIGSNDLTQLILGIDRDSEELASLFDERNEAVKRAIAELIHTARRVRCKVGICGQAPSDYPEFAAFLVDEGIDSISLNPDSVLQALQHLSKLEKEKASIKRSA